jgi:hypothetical protein
MAEILLAITVIPESCILDRESYQPPNSKSEYTHQFIEHICGTKSK